MTAQVLPFSFKEKTIRTVLIDGEPWFVAVDVAVALGYRNAPDAARHLDDDEKGTQIVRTPGGSQKVTVINESGLYALVLRSRKPDARKFAKWVTGEVLPSIRKTGSYMAPAFPARFLCASDPAGKVSMMPLSDTHCVVDSTNLTNIETFLREFVDIDMMHRIAMVCVYRLSDRAMLKRLQ